MVQASLSAKINLSAKNKPHGYRGLRITLTSSWVEWTTDEKRRELDVADREHERSAIGLRSSCELADREHELDVAKHGMVCITIGIVCSCDRDGGSPR
ncbi:hypothetical protein F2Q69_00015638 [Brassica cretica]|uniref:Uncharacterized protein n=1 Tax=Brassica cretica TaxID=69181 RepID=A0A8S9QXD7_BRACR|nr:hypothetical protein F2Q69_00015638 [Brassica cretica]